MPEMSLDIAPLRCPEALLVSASSYLVDRFVPECELVCLPAKDVAGGRLTLGLGPVEAKPPGAATGGRRRWLPGGPARQAPLETGETIVDFRLNGPENWAHFLTNHLPLLAVMCRNLELAPGAVTVVLPARTPAHIQAVAGLFGLRVLCTDRTLRGTGVRFSMEPWTGVRPQRHEWARDPALRRPLDAAMAAARAAGGFTVPRRVFLSRDSTRRLSNEAEIEALLAARGFVKLYPERLSPADQFRLFEEAEAIAAIHGAALAPLLYRSGASRLETLVELLPCGHMTDVYRVMSGQVGCRWIGVRGVPKPEYIEPAFHGRTPFTRFSLDAFELDPRSLEAALAHVLGTRSAPTRPGAAPTPSLETT